MQQAKVTIIGGDFNLDAKDKEEDELTKKIVKTHWGPNKNKNSVMITPGQKTCCADQRDKGDEDFGKQYDRIAVLEKLQNKDRLSNMNVYAFKMKGNQKDKYKKAVFQKQCARRDCNDANIPTGCKVLCAFQQNAQTELNVFTPNTAMKDSAEHLPIVATLAFDRKMTRRVV